MTYALFFFKIAEIIIIKDANAEYTYNLVNCLLLLISP